MTEMAQEVPVQRAVLLRRLAIGLILVLLVVLLTVLPPLIHIGRYQRRVTAAMTGALGRPVHFDSIAFHLLPLPGLTIQNFVVSENPRFGAEPVLRANTVEARLRLGSLWRRRVEISRIDLQSPSVNLVHLPDGEWNLGGILMQASRIESAPTAQVTAGSAPRFPYIQATDARVNVKMGELKLPFSITGAALALWLPAPDEWHVRLAGKPVRTDTDVSDIGELRIEGTLGRAADLAAAPVSLHLDWKPTPLGEMSKMLVTADAGWRGAMSAQMSLQGTLGAAKMTTDLQLRDVRRADFVPPKQMQVDLHCEAAAAGVLHSLHEVSCVAPTEETGSGLGTFFSVRAPASASPEPKGVLTVTAEVPSLTDWRTAYGGISRQGSPQYALDWLRLFSRRIPAGLRVSGESTLAIAHRPANDGSEWTGYANCGCVVSGWGERPADSQAPKEAEGQPWTVRLVRDAEGSLPNAPDLVEVHAHPVTVPERGRTVSGAAAMLDADGTTGLEGYTLRYESWAAAKALSAMLPPLGDGMPKAAVGGLQAQRRWGTGQPQVWSAVVTQKIPRRRR